jgi:excisionase family DNA binding protein
MPTDPARAGHRLMEVSHVAHRWSVSQEFVRRLIRRGQLPAILVGQRWRIAEPEVQAYLDRQRHAGPDDCRSLHAVPVPKGA